MQGFGVCRAGAKVAFVSTYPSFQSSFARGSVCLSKSRRRVGGYRPQKHVRAVLDTDSDTIISQGLAPEQNREQEFSNASQNDEQPVNSLPDQSDQGSENAWYSVVERVGHDDTEAVPRAGESPNQIQAKGVIDLMELESAGQQILVGSSYDNVVDVDIEEGGVLDEDEDNNDLHCGVELDALIESPVLVENLRRDFGIETATHVQLAAIPRVLDGRDIVIQSHTGSGKTLAFLLPILDEIDETAGTVQAIIVTPTRELGMQISRECDRLIEGTDIRSLALIGGANPIRQVEKLRKKLPHIVIGTPGRLGELYDQRELRAHGVRWLVIDEIDQCLGAAFIGDILKLLKAINRKQIVLVSATGDVERVRHFSAENLHRPVLLRVGGAQRIPKRIQHFCCIVPARLRIELVKRLMNTSPIPKRAIAFVDDPRRVDIVVEKLYRMGLLAGGLKGSAHKMERADVLTAIRKGRINLLVTTEVAARGLDVRDVTHVFNLDLPTDGDHYLHRAGRCGRAGDDGFVISIASPDKGFVINRLAKDLGIHIPRMEPRFGKYSDPEVRAKRTEAKAIEQRRSTVSKSASEKNEKSMAVNKKGDMKESLASLQSALERNDAAFIKNSFLKEAEGNAGLEDENATSYSSKPKKRKEKLRGKLKAKAKARAKDKEKKKTAELKAEAKKKKREQEEVKLLSTESYSGIDKGARKEVNRLRHNPSHRAITEGWVGNRVGLDQEE